MAGNPRMKALVAQVVVRTRNFIEDLSTLSCEEALRRKVRVAAKAKRAEARAKAEYDTLAPSIMADMQKLGKDEVVASPFAFAQIKAPSKSIPSDEKGTKIFLRLSSKLGQEVAIRIVDVTVGTKTTTTYKVRSEVMDKLPPADQAKVLEIIGNKPALVVDFPTAASKSGKTPAERRALRKSKP